MVAPILPNLPLMQSDGHPAPDGQHRQEGRDGGGEGADDDEQPADGDGDGHAGGDGDEVGGHLHLARLDAVNAVGWDLGNDSEHEDEVQQERLNRLAAAAAAAAGDDPGPGVADDHPGGGHPGGHGPADGDGLGAGGGDGGVGLVLAEQPGAEPHEGHEPRAARRAPFPKIVHSMHEGKEITFAFLRLSARTGRTCVECVQSTDVHSASLVGHAGQLG